MITVGNEGQGCNRGEVVVDQVYDLKDQDHHPEPLDEGSERLYWIHVGSIDEGSSGV